MNNNEDNIENNIEISVDYTQIGIDYPMNEGYRLLHPLISILSLFPLSFDVSTTEGHHKG